MIGKLTKLHIYVEYTNHIEDGIRRNKLDLGIPARTFTPEENNS